MQTKKIGLVAALCLLLTACGENSKIEKQVRANLKDPDSAKFGDIVKVTSKVGMEYACAVVNAKNSMGGYVGDKVASLVKLDGEWSVSGFYHSSLSSCVSDISGRE